MGVVADDPQKTNFLNERGQLIHCKYWATDSRRRKQPRALVFISHGLAEHSGWYDCIAEPLSARGVLVFAHDHVGHGQSAGDRVHITDVMDYVRDVVQHVKDVSAQHPDVPVYLIGHSMGGMIATLAVLENPAMFKGLVLIGPLIMTDPRTVTPLKVFAARVLAWLCPQVHVGQIEPELISRDKEVVKRYMDDPLNYHKGCKASLGSAVLHMLPRMQARLHEVTCPLLIIHGDQDQLCDVAGAKMLNMLSMSSDKSLTIYENAYHQVHQEPEGEGEKCISQITDWILARV